jgi:hypothetical protein
MKTELPTVAACDEALGALAELFDALPQSHRPMHAGNREDIRRLIERLRRYIIAVGASGPSVRAPMSASASASEPDESRATPGESRAAPGGVVRIEARTKAEEKKAMRAVKEIYDAILALEFDADRQELFDRLLEVVCPQCGSKEDPSEHDCPNASDDDDDDEDDEGEEEEQEPDDQRAGRAAAKSEAVVLEGELEEKGA